MPESTPVTYDAEADALYVRLAVGPVAKTVAMGDLRMIDYAKDGTVIGVEFLQASGGLDLSEIPQPKRIEQLISQGGLHFRIFA